MTIALPSIVCFFQEGSVVERIFCVTRFLLHHHYRQVVFSCYRGKKSELVVKNLYLKPENVTSHQNVHLSVQCSFVYVWIFFIFYFILIFI